MSLASPRMRYVAATTTRDRSSAWRLVPGRARNGVLYLENNTATNVFTPARLELSKLLLAQAATAVENAVLYANLHRRTESPRARPRSAQGRVLGAGAERARRAEAPGRIIRCRSARLAELSAHHPDHRPDRLVMPLTRDDGPAAGGAGLEHGAPGGRNRAAPGGRDHRIHGVRTVDGDVANAPDERRRRPPAARGAQAVICGHPPDVAQSAHPAMQIDLGAVVAAGDGPERHRQRLAARVGGRGAPSGRARGEGGGAPSLSATGRAAPRGPALRAPSGLALDLRSACPSSGSTNAGLTTPAMRLLDRAGDVRDVGWIHQPWTEWVAEEFALEREPFARGPSRH